MTREGKVKRKIGVWKRKERKRKKREREKEKERKRNSKTDIKRDESSKR
jgi:hypothetical protein